ncbi:hypothetical protein TRFO_12233 [Tritrichomonas foetus]|uniref:Protein kinase domain-containing protein n=1 Tax=Tritrichomonas foetus TaxID=1144522 RepID=A0A1J4IZT9_9EUKA|nr:hypothetical protein TRFO_12233 [Tritrichomonas foetus]|eukprot:OHS92864.1 hypothetical protein TRFO_12233 [Tritrichomonas foetus]
MSAPEDDMSNLDHLLVTIGEFQIQQQIGKGGYGEVYFGIHTRTGRKVAIKKLLLEKLEGQALVYFNREVQILACCDNYFLLPFIGYSNKPPYIIVTDFVPCGSLFEALRHKPGSPILNGTNKTLLAMGIVEGMIRLHDHNVIHRDLKSLNILIDQETLPKICDFGIARFIKNIQSDGTDQSNYMTANIGTPHWMAPEILKSGNYTTKVDVYAFGILLWELLTESVPFRGINEPYQVALKVVNGERPPIPPGAPFGIRNLLPKLWHQNAEIRPTFREIFEKFKSHEVMFRGANEEKIDEFVTRFPPPEPPTPKEMTIFNSSNAINAPSHDQNEDEVEEEEFGEVNYDLPESDNEELNANPFKSDHEAPIFNETTEENSNIAYLYEEPIEPPPPLKPMTPSPELLTPPKTGTKVTLPLEISNFLPQNETQQQFDKDGYSSTQNVNPFQSNQEIPQLSNPNQNNKQNPQPSKENDTFLQQTKPNGAGIDMNNNIFLKYFDKSNNNNKNNNVFLNNERKVGVSQQGHPSSPQRKSSPDSKMIYQGQQFSLNEPLPNFGQLYILFKQKLNTISPDTARNLFSTIPQIFKGMGYTNLIDNVVYDLASLLRRNINFVKPFLEEKLHVLIPLEKASVTDAVITILISILKVTPVTVSSDVVRKALVNLSDKNALPFIALLNNIGPNTEYRDAIFDLYLPKIDIFIKYKEFIHVITNLAINYPDFANINNRKMLIYSKGIESEYPDTVIASYRSICKFENVATTTNIPIITVVKHLNMPEYSLDASLVISKMQQIPLSQRLINALAKASNISKEVGMIAVLIFNIIINRYAQGPELIYSSRTWLQMPPLFGIKTMLIVAKNPDLKERMVRIVEMPKYLSKSILSDDVEDEVKLAIFTFLRSNIMFMKCIESYSNDGFLKAVVDLASNTINNTRIVEMCLILLNVVSRTGIWLNDFAYLIEKSPIILKSGIANSQQCIALLLTLGIMYPQSHPIMKDAQIHTILPTIKSGLPNQKYCEDLQKLLNK